MMIVRTAIFATALLAVPAAAQTSTGSPGAGIVTSLNTPIGPDGIFPLQSSLGTDPKARDAARLMRLRELLAANPGATEKLAAMTDRDAKVAYIRSLDRSTPRARR